MSETGMGNFSTLYRKANADQNLRDKYEYQRSQRMDEVSLLREARDTGRAEGKDVQARETAINLHRMGLSVNQIAAGVSYPVDTVQQWLEVIE